VLHTLSDVTAFLAMDIHRNTFRISSDAALVFYCTVHSVTDTNIFHALQSEAIYFVDTDPQMASNEILKCEKKSVFQNQ
jgi:hypothetical protein